MIEMNIIMWAFSASHPPIRLILLQFLWFYLMGGIQNIFFHFLESVDKIENCEDWLEQANNCVH